MPRPARPRAGPPSSTSLAAVPLPPSALPLLCEAAARALCGSVRLVPAGRGAAVACGLPGGAGGGASDAAERLTVADSDGPLRAQRGTPAGVRNG